MSDMPNNSEALKFEPPQEGNKPPMHFDGVVDGSSARVLEPIEENNDQNGPSVDAEIGRIKGALITSYPGAETRKAPPGMVGPVGNQGREASGGDRTGGIKKGLGFRITAGVMAGVAAAGIGYGVFKDKINSFLGIGETNPNDLPPGQTISASGEMPSQSLEPATPSVEVTPSPSPTEAPTPTLDEFGFTKERKAGLNEEIQKFLNKEGEYTQEKIFSMMMETTSPLDPSEIGLGFAGSQLEIQGYFFDYFEKENRIFMLMGFDGKDGNRFVTLVEIPVYFDKNIEGPVFLYKKYKVNNILGIDNTTSADANGDIVKSPEGNIEDGYCYSKSEIISLLDSLRSKVINPKLKYWFSEFADLPADYLKSDLFIDYFNESNSKIELVFELLQLVSSNGITYEDLEKSDTSSILIFNNVDNIGDIDVSKVPVIASIGYFVGILESK